jgi:hypothetical protein
VRDSVWKAGAKAAHASPPTAKKPTRPVPSSAKPGPHAPTSIKAKRKRPLEQAIAKTFLGERKLNKYLRDRAEFFDDSRSNLLRAYYRITADQV